jgi:PncC family amidohydrolase
VINKELLIQVIEEIKKLNLTIGAVESFTGGLFSSSLTSVNGVSSIFKGSIVSYSSAIKEKVVGVNHETIEKETVVSKEVAEEMALQGSKILETDITVSFTGNAGPTVCEGEKPVGLIYISIYFQKNFYTYECRLNADRNAIRETAVDFALKNILKILAIFQKKPHLY